MERMKRRILLLEQDQEQSSLFTGWLKEVGYQVKPIDNLKEVYSSLSKEKFDILLMDIDYPAILDASLELCRTLKKDSSLQDLPITVISYQKDGRKIAGAIEAGVDNIVLKPFDTDTFLERIEVIFKEIEFKKQGKKILDLTYINYLINITGQLGREDFFLLAPVIFNRLIMDKVKTILGEPVIMVMVKRLKELVAEGYEFMKSAGFSRHQLVMDEIDKASKGVPVEKLASGFRDYIYAFLHLVQALTSDILVERGVDGNW